MGSKLKDKYILSQVGGPWYYQITGRPFLLADLCIKGDFSIYEEFRSTLNKDDNTGDGLMAHMFAMIALFMRLDLAENFREKDLVAGAGETLLYLLDPSLLTQLKDNLQEAMIPFTNEDEFEFDLINNPRYHPKNRIKFLAKLVFSTEFSYLNSTCRGTSKYSRLRRLISDLYDSFDIFRNKWNFDDGLDHFHCYHRRQWSD